MCKQACSSPIAIYRRMLMAVVFAGMLLASQVQAFTLNVVDEAGNAVTDYRWLVQEDNTYDAVGNAGIRNNYNALSVSIHKSHARVIAAGSGAAVSVPATERYYVSVLAPGFSLGGAAVRPGQGSATVVLNTNPIPLAQISILVFEDNQPVNGAPDAPGERLLSNFKIYVYDQAGQMATDAFGNPIGTTYDLNSGATVTMGLGYALSTATGDKNSGNALIPNLAPGKYGVRAVPNDGKPWVQTATIEGTPGIDAWIVAGEPPHYTEAGFFGVHAFIGFVLPSSYYQSLGDTTTNQFRALLPGETAGSITGQVVANRINRPPLQMGLNPGVPIPEAYVALSDTGNGNRQVYAGRCDADSFFSIANVPPGTYTLTMWDLPLDQLIDFRTVVVPPTGGTVAMGQIPIFQWFGIYEGSIFYDTNQNGIKDNGESGIANQALNLRFRDGTIYQATVTDGSGEFAFPEVFPFFKWLVAESDFARFKPTGATVYVDKGGPLVTPWPNDTLPLLETRTDLGTVLVEGLLLYFDETARIDWGRVEYAPGENGGISGVVYYATTRAQADPRLSGAETWEPGIPDVTINLYRVTGYDGNGKPIVQGPINTTMTDSWDKNLPTGCKSAMQAAGLSLTPQGIPLNQYIDCAETISVWNQTKPAVFDGGYAFTADAEGNSLASGVYVVEVIPPAGYELVKEEDVNAIVAGETYTPSIPQPALLPAACVGADRVVPDKHSFDGSTIDADSPVFPYVGLTRPLCDRKLVTLSDGQNAAADFHLFTQVPPAGRLVGLVTDDMTLEFRRGNPRLGDKIGPSFMPISIQDFAGHELVRTYTDEWGQYNALVPSTYTVNVAMPTGVSPNVVKIVLNHRGFDPANPDPYFNPGYPTVAWQFDVWPAKITYVDTPIIPIRPNFGGLDCNLPDKIPVIREVNGPAGGPWVETSPSQIVLTSVGNRAVEGGTRDFGFGSVGGDVFATPPGDLLHSMATRKLQVISWANDIITLSGKLDDGITPLPNGEYQITVRRGDSFKTNVAGITLHVGTPSASVRRVTPGIGAIQAAIDSANTGDLILIAPGTYTENLIMYKNVKLQGYGAESTTINAAYFTPEKQAAWLAKLNAITGNQLDPDFTVPGERPDLFLEQGSGILVLARQGDFTGPGNPARIDGLTITGANEGGGIFVHGYAHFLQITNNKLNGNQGTAGGGIRVGTPSLFNPGVFDSTYFQSSFNDNITLANNEIVMNGAWGLTLSSGGGIGIYTGADNYTVSDSWICGNYSMLAGAGIAQQGLSDGGKIRNNTILLNESWDEAAGIFLAGEIPPVGLPGAPVLTPGTGSVLIEGNLIQGNKAGNLGGGVTLFRVNGLDVASNPTNTTAGPAWYKTEIFNNIIVNNLAGAYGAGIASFDALDTVIVHNTIANNDSTATGEMAFGNIPWAEGFVLSPTAFTAPMPSGIGVEPFSANLASAIDPSISGDYGAYGGTRTPVIENNIIYNNYAYYWNGYDPVSSQGAVTLAGVWDTGVLGVPGAKLNVQNSLLTDTTGYAGTNSAGDPRFFVSYRNNISATQGGAALGNFVNYAYTPMSLVGNYHIRRVSPAVDSGDSAALTTYGSNGVGSWLDRDVDGVRRSMGFSLPVQPDRGADEYNSAGDVNCDGQVNAQDALLALSHIVNAQVLVCAQNADTAPLTETGMPVGDSLTNLSDVLAILLKATGMVNWQ